MKKRKKGRRFNTSAVRQSPRQRTVELEPEELAIYVRRAEKEVLPIIKEMQLGPGTAQFLLAQQTQVLVTGDPRLTTEGGMAIANNVLALWQEGYYTLGPAYPYTLEEALLELQEGPNRDPVKAQSSLEAISSASRKGGAHAKIAALYRQVQTDGEPKQLLYEMMLYLI